jgi:primosomal protein N' (replication factor Y)
MDEGGPYAQVIVDIASADTDRVYTYRAKEGMALSLGTRVLVPFGRQTLEGLVTGFTDSAGIQEERVRDIIEPLEPYPAILPDLVNLAKEISARTHCPLALSLRLMIPAEMRAGRVKTKTQTTVRLAIPLRKQPFPQAPIVAQAPFGWSFPAGQRIKGTGARSASFATRP